MTGFTKLPTVAAMETACAYLALAGSLGAHVTLAEDASKPVAKMRHTFPRGTDRAALSRLAAFVKASGVVSEEVLLCAAAAVDAGTDIYSRQTGVLKAVEYHVSAGSRPVEATSAIVARIAAQWFIRFCRAHPFKLSLDFEDDRFGLWFRASRLATPSDIKRGERAQAWLNDIPGARGAVIDALASRLDPNQRSDEVAPSFHQELPAPFMQAAE